MQTALNSLRLPPTKLTQRDGKHLYGIGSDKLTLSGNFKFRVVSGVVSFCGVLLEGGEWFEVSSPTMPYPTFTSITSVENFKVVDGLEEYKTVIEVVNSDHFRDLKNLIPQFKVMWHQLNKLDLSVGEGNDLDAAGEGEGYIFSVPKGWQDVELMRKNIVLGPQNSGKSSFCKYAINKYLANGGESVYYLETDPGQPEYTTSGNLTLHLINHIEFNPSYTHPHFAHVVKSVHFGYTSPSETPHRYLEIIDHLLSLVPGNHKLVVNTPGWIKGLGLELNQEIYLKMGYDTQALHMGPSEFTQIDTTELELPQNTSTLSFSSAELRNLQISTYLHKDTSEPITNLAPYDVPLGTETGIYAVGVLDAGGIDLNADISICVEGTLVSINLVPQEYETSQFILTELEANNIWQNSNSVGLAVVQLIQRNSLRLLTPFNVDLIDFSKYKVVLLRGRIELPTWEIADANIKNAIPWVSVDKPMGIGGQYTKFRRNIVRK